MNHVPPQDQDAQKGEILLLKAALKKAYDHSNCYCEECRAMVGIYWSPGKFREQGVQFDPPNGGIGPTRRLLPKPSQGELDHPCKNTCSGWKQGYEQGMLVERETWQKSRELPTPERCKHDVHGTDCFECFPSQTEEEDCPPVMPGKKVGEIRGQLVPANETEEEMAHEYLNSLGTPGSRPWSVVYAAALWGLRRGAEAEREKTEKVRQMGNIAYEAEAAAGRIADAEIERLKAELEENAKAYVEFFANLIEGLPKNDKRKAEIAVFMQAREARKKLRASSGPKEGKDELPWL